MDAIGKNLTPFAGSLKTYAKKYTNESGKQQVWKSILVQVSPCQFKILFPNEIKLLFFVELWEKNICPLRKHTYLCLENEEWKIGLIKEGRFDVQVDRFSVWVRDKLLDTFIKEMKGSEPILKNEN